MNLNQTDLFLMHSQSPKYRFKSLYNHSNYGIPFSVGHKYYITGKSGLTNQDIIYSKDSIDSEDVDVFVDPNRIDPNGNAMIDWTAFSTDGRYCAYDLWFRGVDWSTIRIRDTQTLRDLPDVLTKIKFSSVAWTRDSLGFFYSVSLQTMTTSDTNLDQQYDEYNGTLDGTETDSVSNQKLFYHRLNTSQSEDIVITSFPGHKHRFM